MGQKQRIFTLPGVILKIYIKGVKTKFAYFAGGKDLFPKKYHNNNFSSGTFITIIFYKRW
jgi:hypothetical protein